MRDDRSCVDLWVDGNQRMNNDNQTVKDPLGGPRDDLASLVVAFVKGDVAAARALMTAVGGPVLRAARVVLGPGHGDLEDAVQDAMIGLLEGLHRFRGECSVSHFAGRVGVLTAMAVRRRQQTRERWVLCDEVEGISTPAGPESSPLARLEAARRRDKVRQLLDELPEPIAEAVALHFMLGYSVQEVAASSHVPVNTVWSRLRIGKERIRVRLGADPAGAEELSDKTVCG
jgi:RNA polymerase sigma factor (sigma-70 family)